MVADMTCSDLCDTDAGYQRHRWHGERTCARSRRAHAAHNAAVRHVERPPRELAGHGTRAAYERERKARKAYLEGRGPEAPEPCAECTAANAARARQRAS
jgi:hypothetical protein